MESGDADVEFSESIAVRNVDLQLANREMVRSVSDPLAGLHRAAQQIPLSELAEIRVLEGPNLIKGEGGLLCSYVQCNVRGRDVVGFVDEAKRAIAAGVELPRACIWNGAASSSTKSAPGAR